jgi:hypothetical protein
MSSYPSKDKEEEQSRAFGLLFPSGLGLSPVFGSFGCGQRQSMPERTWRRPHRLERGGICQPKTRQTPEFEHLQTGWIRVWHRLDRMSLENFDIQN